MIISCKSVLIAFCLSRELTPVRLYLNQFCLNHINYIIEDLSLPTFCVQYLFNLTAQLISFSFFIYQFIFFKKTHFFIEWFTDVMLCHNLQEIVKKLLHFLNTYIGTYTLTFNPLLMGGTFLGDVIFSYGRDS